MSSSFRSKMYLCVAATPTRYPAVVWTMPFGLPVVPDVYSMKSMSSASIASAGHARDCSGTRSCHQMSRFGLIRTSCAVRLSTSTFSTTPFAIPSASSTRSLRRTTFPRRKPPSAVTTTFDSASWIRSAMDFALTNHFAWGRSHSNTFVHGARNVTRSAAIFAQNPSKSFSARRWSSSPFTHARSRKEGGGSNDCPPLRSESIVRPSLGIALGKPDVSLIDLARSPRGASRGRPGGDVRRAREALRGRGGARWRVPRHSVRHHVRPARPERRGQDDTPPDLARAHGAELRDREGPRLEHPPP